mmetsp:Transcript_18485/g.30685  ORF Transcript_18485/g.30685 Transcript_18485/m.30685 type:complete len:85 (+) Transcript_18485:306-560(+)
MYVDYSVRIERGKYSSAVLCHKSNVRSKRSTFSSFLWRLHHSEGNNNFTTPPKKKSVGINSHALLSLLEAIFLPLIEQVRLCAT